MTKHFILATAGHVDHGKSSLVKSLTGIDPDRLPEEKARGITIELGFARLVLTAPGHPESQLRVGIVDVPGHEDFVTNMVAGVGSVDMGLLVVAADDGWMPQTEEHLQILSYLGVTRLVVAITKVDLPGADPVAVEESVRQLLGETPFAPARIVPVSSVTGCGMDALKSTIAAVLATAPEPRDIGKPRLAIDRAFTLRGVGTVVTGTLTGGQFRAGQTAVVRPGGNPVRIRSIQTHNENVPVAGPGMRTALNLADLAVAGHGSAAVPHAGARRGDVVTLAECGEPVQRLDVLLTRLPRSQRNPKTDDYCLKDGQKVRIHHGAGAWTARVNLVEGNDIAPGQKRLARLCFESPIFAFINDRFIVRDPSERRTLAGGLVLSDAEPPTHFRNAARREFLERAAAALEKPAARLLAELRFQGVAPRSGLLRKSNFSCGDLARALEELGLQGAVVLLDQLVAEPRWWAALCERAAECIKAFHQAQPEQLGMPLTQLRVSLSYQVALAGVFEAVVGALLKAGFVQAGAVIREAMHRPTLPPRLQAAGARLRSALAAKPLEPPSRNELAKEPNAQQALRFLIQTGEVVELGPETIMMHEGVAHATRSIKEFLVAHGPATVSQLRQAVGTSRRVIVPLLECLDRSGVTLRQGDNRVLRERKI